MIDYKIDDIDIINEKPITINVGKKKILLRELSVYQFFEIYIPCMYLMLNLYTKLLKDIDLQALDDVDNKKRIEKMAAKIQNLFSNSDFRKTYISMLVKMKILKMSRRYFEKHCTVAHLVSIFIHIYLFNTDGYKKKMRFLMEKIGIRKNRILETFTTSSIEEVGFQKILKPRFRLLKNSKNSKS